MLQCPVYLDLVYLFPNQKSIHVPKFQSGGGGIDRFCSFISTAKKYEFSNAELYICLENPQWNWGTPVLYQF